MNQTQNKPVTTGSLRIWWIPQVPMQEPFYVPVQSVDEAKLVYRTLANYDLFQFENKVKPDYCNAGGLQVFLDGEWEDWENDDCYSLDEIMSQEE